MESTPPYVALALFATITFATSAALAAGDPAAPASDPARVSALEAKIAELEQRVAPPELGDQMLLLQIRHDRLWWAGKAGNWNLAYFMVGELGEALRGIERANGDAAELQPQKLSDVMPSMMNPALRKLQKALENRDRAQFAAAYDELSASCTACHRLAGAEFLRIERPKTPLLDNLRYAPAGSH